MLCIHMVSYPVCVPRVGAVHGKPCMHIACSNLSTPVTSGNHTAYKAVYGFRIPQPVELGVAVCGGLCLSLSVAGAACGAGVTTGKDKSENERNKRVYKTLNCVMCGGLGPGRWGRVLLFGAQDAANTQY